MDALKDFVSGLKERFSSPFFTSFIVSWMIYNYPIIIVLLFYKQSELIHDGYSSYLDLIRRHSHPGHKFLYPFYWALAYSILSPVIKETTRFLQSWLISFTDSKINDYTNEHNITVEQHTGIVSTLNETKKQYIDLISTQGVTKAENKNLLEKIDEIIRLNEIDKSTLIETHQNRLQAQQKQYVGIIGEGKENEAAYSQRLTEVEKNNELLAKELQKSRDDLLAVEIDSDSKSNYISSLLKRTGDNNKNRINVISDVIKYSEKHFISVQEDIRELYNSTNNEGLKAVVINLQKETEEYKLILKKSMDDLKINP